jgi:glycosyltransferase involved in cell wall biosynthesis
VRRYRSSGGGSAVARGLGRPEEDWLPTVALRETRFHRKAPPIVVCQNALNFLPTKECARIAGWRFAADPRQLLRGFLAKRNVRRAQHIVCFSRSMERIVAASVPRRRGEIETSHITIPLDLLDGIGHRKETGLGSQIVHLGSVLPYKRIETLLEAAASTGSHCEVLLAGKADQRYLSRLFKLATTLKIELKSDEWSRADVEKSLGPGVTVVLTSSIESLSFPLSEAVVLGCRVIASDIDAHLELAQRLAPMEVSLFPVGDHNVLAKMLTEAPLPMHGPTTSQLECWRSEWKILRDRLTTLALGFRNEY